MKYYKIQNKILYNIQKRICYKCGLEKDFNDFYKFNNKPKSFCKSCVKNNNKNVYQSKQLEFFLNIQSEYNNKS